jgi:hypothetical protein
MKQGKEDSIDKLFSDGLQNPGDNAAYQEQDWEQLQAMLDDKKPRRAVARVLYIVAVVAAMLVLGLGWFYFDKAPVKQQTNAKVTPRSSKDTGNYGPPVQQLAKRTSITLSADSNSTPLSGADENRKSRSFFTLSAAVGGRKFAGFNPGKYQSQTNNALTPTPTQTAYIKNDTVPPLPTQIANAANADINKQQQDNYTMADRDTVVSSSINSIANNNATNKDSAAAQGFAVAANNRQVKAGKARQSLSFRPTFAISILAAPDINSVNGFSQNRAGTNVGLLFSVGVSRKWSFSTGAIYADKPYTSPFSLYSTSYKFKTDPSTVAANCTVLDIPLNVNYQFYNKQRNKFSLGTGLSSYIMLRENYTFNYNGGAAQQPATYNIRNRNQHFFGVLNLNATYQREVSSRFDIGVQPYLKLPLTDIGYGQVNLKSAGVAVGVTWKLKTNAKP